MAITQARAAIGRIFYQRCFYLFLVLLALIVGVPFVEPTPFGRFAVNLMGIGVDHRRGRGHRSHGDLVRHRAAPRRAGRDLSLAGRHDRGSAVDAAVGCFAAALYATTLAYLLRYVFQRDVMTADRLFGAAAAYLLIGVLWSYLYAIVGYVYPGSFGSSGSVVALTTYDYLYFSFTVLTSTGFGDITPLLRQARSLCVFEQLVGTLFLAILIARLAGVYPPEDVRDTR